ncbi:MAG TPA: DUF6445 family protein [Sphingomicrobium sp.]|jgi:hypothetical protein|nr:DUF6445 family protein [Sphingomicrobium sp.]
MYTTFLLVDDFLDNAEALRAHALTLDYPNQQGQFPGRNSLQRVNIDGLTEAVGRVLGERLVAAPPPQSHAKTRLTLAADKGRGKVHVDESHWSGILYLSRPEDCRGGTEFFRHKATGLDRFPFSREEQEAHGFASAADAHAELIERDGTDDSAWDLLMTVPMRFNRLLLLRPWLFHTAGPGFGDRPENARLVYLMFFNQPPHG